MDIPPKIQKRIQEAQEKQLTELDLSNSYYFSDKLTAIPDEVFELTQLEVLNLEWNLIREIPEKIAKLSNLKQLHLSNNQLTTVPDSLTKLSNLTYLSLSNNQLTTVPDSLSKLSNLISLNLRDNQLTTVPDSLSKLSNLTFLFLSRNQLTTVPDSLTKLSNLTYLSLSRNQLTTVPDSITNLSNLTTLYLSNNPLENPPLEVCAKGIQAIREYFRQIKEKGFDYLYEAKLLIIGEAGAGKTTLAKKIQNPDYQLKVEDSTKGIDVITYEFDFDPPQPPLKKGESERNSLNRGENEIKVPLTKGDLGGLDLTKGDLGGEKKQAKFRMNIWDFGGQEIYHATHKFFLTKRSLYTLIIDNRKEDDNLIYWLQIVELLSENSPLLIIKNEIQNRQRNIDEASLRGRFTNLKEILTTNLATKKNLGQILSKIKHYITDLPHVGDVLPKTWTKVREILEQNPDNYITLSEYFNICQENGFTKREDNLQLSGYLHDLGVCLHFQDDIKSPLYKTIILKPEWGTNAVYKILDNDTVKSNFGKFTDADLANIWDAPQYADMQGELLQLMMKFQLCYQIPNTKDTYIAPQLLSPKKPPHNWNEENNLIVRYEYDFMPKGIITQFIVIMHRLIYQQKYVWKSGVILAQNETLAEIVESYDQREIKIRVVGKGKKELMTNITYEFGKIHDSYKHLKYDKLIPCNCSVCKNNQNPEFYKFEKLIKRINDGELKIQCDTSYEYINDVRSLIDDVIDIQQEEELKKQESSKIVNEFYFNQGMESKRIIQTGGGDYTEGYSRKIQVRDNAKYVEGNDYSNSASQENLENVATTLKNLLDYFEQNPNLTIPQAKQQIDTITNNTPEILNAEIITQAIEATPTLKQRLKAAGEAVYLETVKMFLPPMGIAIEAIKAYKNPQ